MIITNATILYLLAIAYALIFIHYRLVRPPNLLKEGVEGKSNKDLILGVLNELVSIRMRRTSSLVLSLVAMSIVTALGISNLISDSGSVFINGADYNYMLSMFGLLAFTSVCLVYFALATAAYEKGYLFLESLDDDDDSVGKALDEQIDKYKPKPKGSK